MSSLDIDKSVCESILTAGFSVPIAWSAWVFGTEDVFLSNDMKRLIGAKDNVGNAYEFVSGIRNIFGNFLNCAIEEAEKSEFGYQTPVLSKSGESYNAVLRYNQKKEVYILFLLRNSGLDHSDSFYFESDTLESKYKKLLTMLDVMPFYVWQRDRDLKLTYCNKKYAEALETTVENVLKDNSPLFSKDSEKCSHMEKKALISGKSQTGSQHVIINGNRRLLEAFEYPQNGRIPAFGCATDITDKEDLLKEFNNYKKQTDETLNHISAPIAIFDENRRLTFANESLLKMFGMDESYANINPHCLDILDKLRDDRKLPEIENYSDFKKKVLSVFTDIISPYHFLVHLPNGDALNVVISPNYGGGIIIVFEDISDKIKLERDYNSLTAIQKETLDHLHEGILVFGTDNRLKITNPSINGIWGKTDEERDPGIHIKEFFESSEKLFKSAEDCESWINLVISMASHRTEFSGTLVLESSKNIDYAYVPLPDGLNLIRFVDSTDKAKLENALKEKTDIMSQIDKLKSSLISNVTYELKSPLNTIMGFSDILMNQYFGSLNERQVEYCSGIINAANRLAEVVEAMINLASIEAGQMKISYSEVKIKEFMEESVALFKGRASTLGVDISVKSCDENLSAYMDVKSMKQVMFQILSKYMKLAPRGGKIDLSASISCNLPDYVEIYVHNVDVGTSKDDLERTRKMLLSDVDEKNIASTMDFGMILANNVIRLHNGKMFIDSGNAGGTTIKFCIPMKPFMI